MNLPIWLMQLLRWGLPRAASLASTITPIVLKKLKSFMMNWLKRLNSSEEKKPVQEKPSNPKDVIGIRKVPFSVLPTPVLWEAALGMMEGALKYGRHNYRAIGVRSSVYYDATQRHLTDWWE